MVGWPWQICWTNMFVSKCLHEIQLRSMISKFLSRDMLSFFRDPEKNPGIFSVFLTIIFGKTSEKFGDYKTSRDIASFWQQEVLVPDHVFQIWKMAKKWEKKCWDINILGLAFKFIFLNSVYPIYAIPIPNQKHWIKIRYSVSDSRGWFSIQTNRFWFEKKRFLFCSD